MAVAVMGPDDNKPVFHDFLRMSCGDPLAAPAPPLDAQAAASASPGASVGARGITVCGNPDLGSERRRVTDSEVLQFHGRKTAIPELEVGNTFSGRKGHKSELGLANLDAMRDKKLPSGSDSLERSNLTMMFGKEVEAEQPGRSFNNENVFSMQPPKRPTSLIIRPPPVSHRPNSPILRWERSAPMSSGQTAHYLPSGIYMGTGSSHKDKDASVGAIDASQSAADEGSRTGNKGYGVLKNIDPGDGVGERDTTGSLPSRNGPVAAQIRESGSNLSSRRGVSSICRQMTIFYAGQAHVFDNVHPNKADVIMALAGSSGGSWSTAYCPNSDPCRSDSDVKIPGSEDNVQASNQRASTQGHSHPDLGQVTLIKDASGPLSQIPGVFQGSVAAGDPQPTEPRVEP